MTVINIGIAGCLGRMGKELVKEVINDNRLSFSGGFEHPQHSNVNRNISDLIDVKTENKVSDNAEKIFSRSLLIDIAP